jgi:hypothetical protein
VSDELRDSSVGNRVFTAEQLVDEVLARGSSIARTDGMALLMATTNARCDNPSGGHLRIATERVDSE